MQRLSPLTHDLAHLTHPMQFAQQFALSHRSSVWHVSVRTSELREIQETRLCLGQQPDQDFIQGVSGLSVWQFKLKTFSHLQDPTEEQPRTDPDDKLHRLPSSGSKEHGPYWFTLSLCTLNALVFTICTSFFGCGLVSTSSEPADRSLRSRAAAHVAAAATHRSARTRTFPSPVSATLLPRNTDERKRCKESVCGTISHSILGLDFPE